MSLKESIRRILKETREEKVKNFVYSKFDRVFDELNLEVEYGENDYYMEQIHIQNVLNDVIIAKKKLMIF